MNTYKQFKARGVLVTDSILRVVDQAYIPFATDNTDYANFKQEILTDQAELQDADGVVMSAEAAKALIETLP